MVGVPNLCFEVFKNGFVQLVTILLTTKNTLCVYVSFEVTVLPATKSCVTTVWSVDFWTITLCLSL